MGRGDDVLFRIADGRLALVHLTWHKESDARWPHTLIISSLEAFAEAVMTPQHLGSADH
jgi:hypothetical protein